MMFPNNKRWLLSSLFFVLLTANVSFAFSVDETPAQPGEWGFRPFDGKESAVNPPGFVWRPQKDADTYQIQCSPKADFSEITYETDGITFNVHTPPHIMPMGKLYWRFRFVNKEGENSEWSQTRSFTISPTATQLPLPDKEDLISRIPKTHPRLFVRPEQINILTRRARADLRSHYNKLVEESDRIVNNPPSTKEPPRYPEDVERKSEEWREIWWGNRVYTIRALNSAATLGFTRLLGGKEEYGELAKKILLECAEWDPKGATGYRYNDEAGMPYNYYFSRTYSFVNDLLTEAEKEKCRDVMLIRGREMYNHLHPRHLWRPYASHSNRAWHFLGEVGIAFLHEIPEAEDWVWFATNVFTNVYPVWSDDQGGWHEGVSYWRSYIARFTWWADVMRVAMDINAYDKPYFSQVGYYPMYLQPPGTHGGGFGDLCAHRRSRDTVGLMSILTSQAQNPYWQWYVDAHGGAPAEDGYIGFIRGALPEVDARPPEDLPTSRCFWGTGQAMLNNTLFDADDNVEIIFKSSPFGTQSHGYESQNSFILYAFGERLFIRTGRRDIYGSKHHVNWMWHTKSTNSITVNGEGQGKHSAAADGKITDFHTGPLFDYVSGEASEAYRGELDRFTRRILFIKPSTVLIFDTLKALEASSFEWWLHSPTEMTINNQNDIRVNHDDASCKANFLWPTNLALSQTDKFDPPPRPRVKLTEYHLTAKTSEKSKQQSFITVLRPHKKGTKLQGSAECKKLENGFFLTIPHQEGKIIVLLQDDRGKVLKADKLVSDEEVAAVLIDPDGNVISQFSLE